jgi:hypothetical protein
MGLTPFLLLSSLEVATPLPATWHYLDTYTEDIAAEEDHYELPPGPFSATSFVGMGIGGGTPGGAAVAFCTGIDVWPLRYLGTGIEASLAAATTMKLLGPNATDAQLSARLRLTGRWIFGAERFWITATVAGGPGTTPNSSGPSTGLGYAGELGFFRQWESLRFGFVLRGEGVREDVFALTMGPNIGSSW